MLGFFCVTHRYWCVYFLFTSLGQGFCHSVVQTLLKTWRMELKVRVERFYLHFLCFFWWTALTWFFWSKQVDSLVDDRWWIFLLFWWPSLNFKRKWSKFHDILSKLCKKIINFQATHSSFRVNLNHIHNNIFKLLTILYFSLLMLWIKLILMPKIHNFIELKHIYLIY